MKKLKKEIKKLFKHYMQDCHDWWVIGQEDFNKLIDDIIKLTEEN